MKNLSINYYWLYTDETSNILGLPEWQIDRKQTCDVLNSANTKKVNIKTLKVKRHFPSYKCYSKTLR